MFTFFILTFTAELLALAMVIVSLRQPHRRFWPPPADNPLRGRLAVLTFILSVLGTLLLGMYDWGSLPLPGWSRWGVGLPLFAAGLGLARWAIASLGREAAVGGSPGLVSHGPYRLTRNPQYLGFVVGLAGWVMLSASRLTLFTAILSLPLLILLPRAEEPWLLGQYEDDYQEYLSQVPRFIGPSRP